MVYFLQPVGGGPVKIGTTGNLDNRLAQLQTAYGVPLAVLATIEGGRDEEKAVHERFAHLRLGKTEQFQPGPDLMAFIGKPLFASMVPVVPMDDRTKPIIAQLRGGPEFKAWLERAAAHSRLNVSMFLEQSAVDAARRAGFPEEAPKR